MKITKIALWGAAVLCAGSAGAQTITRAEYIERYKDVAVEHMEKYGIPASIKLAQGLHESANGNSRLAVRANNHFGIKCKSGWTGATVYHDDDEKNECFRAYSSALASWSDHSEFLDKGSRYQFLFDLDPLDYKAWAEGLKKAGYATNPRYAELIIGIIEENRLYLLDRGVPLLADGLIAGEAANDSVSTFNPLLSEQVDPDRYNVAMYSRGGYGIHLNNGVRFVVAREGDDLASIGLHLGISTKRLRRYNDLGPENTIAAGNAVYLEAKNRRAMSGEVMHTAREGETLHSLSQRYAVKAKRLARMNRLDTSSPGTWFEPLLPGQLIKL